MSATLSLEIEDFTGQVRRRVRDVPRDITVGELVSGYTRQMHLPEVDASGRPVLYGASSSRGEVLNSTDQLGDVLADEDVVTLTKSVTAG
jgi:hypothetical protein